ncbi:hypothetical protein [Nitrosophilus labii]|uniref:hypothetical protein n=1 Tax=Nitrosophilus labii TaxID=2706014 RepID=UPI001656CB2E|nr:hypothetical protein [Nitrosophilus labii]
MKISKSKKESSSEIANFSVHCQIGLEKELSIGDILVKSNGGTVELYGKTDFKEKADKIIDIALKTKGAKKVVFYLIIFQREVISL